MAQFQLYRNQRPSSSEIPYLLDVQSDAVDTGSRLVLPVIPADRHGPPFTRLHPQVLVHGKPHVVVTSDAAAVAAQSLRPPVVADLTGQRHDFLNALDFLLTGY